MNSDQVKGVLQKAGGHIEESAGADAKSERARAFDRDHRVEIHEINATSQEGVDQPDRKRVGRINRKGIEKAEQQSFDQPDRKRA